VRLAGFLITCAIGWWLSGTSVADQPHPALFDSADRCQACHNGLVTPSGRDVSIGIDWRASMMANSARDPYWQAAVRREVMDHPVAREEIEHECSLCHMPMAHVTSTAAGGRGAVFAHLPVAANAPRIGRLAADGVSCTVCHQITNDKLGTPESFTGGFVVDTTTPRGRRQIFGPFQADAARVSVMRSATEFQPAEAVHVQSPEMCATCHTLYTRARDVSGRVIGELPEQVPYLEWRHSSFRDSKSCQSCHMPVVTEPVPVSSVLGDPRTEVSRHAFRGGNFFMMRMLNRYRAELGVAALPQDFEAAVRETIDHLQAESASISIASAERNGSRLVVDLLAENRAGHKLPTAYPSRRVWLHFIVRDAAGRTAFESGRLAPDGRIAGNDNDDDGAAYEPHYAEISDSSQVQIYESIMTDTRGGVTTGLLSAIRYVKDNRLLPAGFDKATADRDIAVYGGAADDGDFGPGRDRIRYAIAIESAGPLTVVAELWFQPIAYRWAQNLRQQRALETDRFVGYYESMADSSAVVLARASVTVPPRSTR
jgi:hypothetical protein